MINGKFSEIEQKWQERWYDVGINEAEPDNRPKFMIIFAYPGVTGYLHVGHLRGYTYVDAIARYMRMVGYNVLFPVGTHATGNGAISLSRKIKMRDKNTLDYMIANGCPPEMIEKLEDPINVVHFFNDVYINQYWKRFGFLADWRRFTCTIYPDYQRFIQWQFKKLMENGLLIKKPYYAPACVECGPVAVDPSETDLQKGGRAEVVEYTLLKFRCEDYYLVAATLRPETVFGQTNFWINPDVEYVKVKKGTEMWIISEPSYEKMRYQKEGLEIVGKIRGRDLVGKKCIAPMIHREILVLPARFCDPKVGTGLVTSVPSDAPDDWIALRELQQNQSMLNEFGLDAAEVLKIKPIPIISIEGWGPLPAVEIVEKMGIKQSGDPKLEEAKKIVYRDGFHKGKMNDNCGPYADMTVQKAKELMRDEMISKGEAEIFYDLSEEVICRCGKPVVIKRVPDQWFIDYGNVELTENSKRHAKTMHILPPEYYSNIQNVLDWFHERACVRQGNWLGTRFPFDDKWIIEAISDSTLYPIYYLVSKYVNCGELKLEQLTDEFFDFVFLGKGKLEDVCNRTRIDPTLLAKIREDVEYWYPLDINLGGKEHMTVHFPAFLMNHVGILEQKFWPRGIFVNWYITGKLGKISKSKGGAEPIPGAAEKFGVDTMRLYYAHIASPFADVEWDEEALENYKSRIERIFKTIDELRNLNGKGELTHIDQWILSRLNSRIIKIRESMKEYDLRLLANEVYFEMMNDIRWYLRRGGNNARICSRILDAWIRMMAPITPHIAEELWENLGKQCFASTSSFPSAIRDELRAEVEEAEEYLRSVIADVNEILNVTGITPKHIHIYTSPSWKYHIFMKALEMAKQKKLSIPELTKLVMKDETIRVHGKEAAEFARKLAESLLKYSEDQLERMALRLDETEFLTKSEPFLEKELNCKISVHSADDQDIPDPQNKARLAIPRRPAIFVE